MLTRAIRFERVVVRPARDKARAGRCHSCRHGRRREYIPPAASARQARRPQALSRFPEHLRSIAPCYRLSDARQSDSRLALRARRQARASSPPTGRSFSVPEETVSTHRTASRRFLARKRSARASGKNSGRRVRWSCRDRRARDSVSPCRQRGSRQALNAQTGAEVWRYPYRTTYRDRLGFDEGRVPCRSSSTVAFTRSARKAS